MDELVFQVTRDTAKWESEEPDMPSVGVWQPKDDVVRDTEIWAKNGCDGVWVGREGHIVQPIFEMTPKEFEKQFGLPAPNLDEKIWIRTSCKWEKVDFKGGD